MRRLFAVVTTSFLALVALIGCGGDGSSGSTLNVYMADAPLPGVTAVTVTIDRVDANINDEWVVLEDTQQVINLFDLTQTATVIGSAGVPPGDYTQVRLIISEATVTDEEGTHVATLPSGAQTGIKVNIDAPVAEGASVGILLDFNVEQSVSKLGNGTYRIDPVIPAELMALAGSISGVAMYSGQMMEGVLVEATYVSGTSYPLGTVVNTSATMADGSFKVWALLEGAYTLSFERIDGGGLVVFNAAAENIAVVPGQNVDLGVVEMILQ